MTGFPSVPLFMGPVELLLVGVVILVLLFGSRATDIARDAGSTVGKVKKTRHTAEKEIEEVRADIEEGVEPVKEEVEAVEEEVQQVEQEVKEVEREVQEAERELEENFDPSGDAENGPGHGPDN